MTITAFYPILYAKDADAALKRYTEELGFVHKHTVNLGYLKSYILEHDGYHVDIATTEREAFQMPDGYYAMRVNVREFDEALAYYQALGYHTVMPPVHTESADLVLLVNQDSDRIFLYHHIRKEERGEV